MGDSVVNLSDKSVCGWFFSPLLFNHGIEVLGLFRVSIGSGIDFIFPFNFKTQYLFWTPLESTLIRGERRRTRLRWDIGEYRKLVLEESVNESRHFDLMMRHLQTEYWCNEVIIISIGLFYLSLRETDRSRSTKNDKLDVSETFSECFQNFWSWKTSKIKLKTRRVEV